MSTTVDPLSALVAALVKQTIEQIASSGVQVNRPLLMGQTEAATLLGLSPTEIANMISRGELKSIRHGRRVLIHTAELYEWVERKRSEG